MLGSMSQDSFDSLPGIEVTTRPGWLAVNEVLRRVSSLGVSSLLAGVVVGGIGGRLVMTVSARAAGQEMFGRVTENGNTIGQFTAGGTFTLVVFVGLLGGIAASIVIVGSDPWLRWAGILRGLGFGLASLAFFGYETFDSIDFAILEPTTLNVLMFLALMIGFGYAVVGFDRVLLRRLAEPKNEPQVVYIVLATMGAFPLLFAVLFFTSTDFCGCQPHLGIGIALVVMLAAAVIREVLEVMGRYQGWERIVTEAAGYASLTTGLVLGLRIVVSDIAALF
jgi:hypothetical protein